MKKLALGGQAVIEGGMIKSNSYIAIAARKNGKIIAKSEKLGKRPFFFRWAFVRGVVNLADLLALGIKALSWSAEQQSESNEKITKLEIAATLLLSVGFAMLIFVVVPYFAAHLAGLREDARPVLFNLVDGMIKVALFVLYVAAISLMKDVRRLFQYHGAEHKAVYCYENGKKLTVENAKRFSRLHARCGTSFLFIVLIVSILLFSALPSAVAYAYPAFAKMNFLAKRAVLVSLRILDT